MTRIILIVTSLLLLTVGLAGCKFVATKTKAGTESINEITYDGRKVDSDALVTELWDTRILPYLDKRAGNFVDVKSLIVSNLNEAGKKYGYREKEEGTPWTIIARAEGKIVTANTASKASTVSIDTDGNTTADLTIQIGPVLKGTALRDGLDFISFNQFTNQIEFAQFAKSLNIHVHDSLLAGLPRDQLIGKTVKVLGAFPLDKADAPILLMPARFELGN